MMMLLMSTGIDLLELLGLERLVDGVLDIQSSCLRVTDEPEIRLEESGRGDAYLCWVMRSLREIPPMRRSAVSIRRPAVSRTMTRWASIFVQDMSSTRSSCTGLSNSSVSRPATRLAASFCTAGYAEKSEGEEVEQDKEGSSYPCYYLQYLEEMTIDLPMAHALRSLTCSYILLCRWSAQRPPFV